MSVRFSAERGQATLELLGLLPVLLAVALGGGAAACRWLLERPCGERGGGRCSRARRRRRPARGRACGPAGLVARAHPRVGLWRGCSSASSPARSAPLACGPARGLGEREGRGAVTARVERRRSRSSAAAILAAAAAAVEAFLLEPAEPRTQTAASTPPEQRPVICVFGLARGCGSTVVARALAAELARSRSGWRGGRLVRGARRGDPARHARRRATRTCARGRAGGQPASGGTPVPGRRRGPAHAVPHGPPPRSACDRRRVRRPSAEPPRRLPTTPCWSPPSRWSRRWREWAQRASRVWGRTRSSC